MSLPTTKPLNAAQARADAIGDLALIHLGKRLPLQVCRSAAGCYIGTADVEGPVSRDSEYFPSAETAERALREGTWAQRLHP